MMEMLNGSERKNIVSPANKQIKEIMICDRDIFVTNASISSEKAGVRNFATATTTTQHIPATMMRTMRPFSLPYFRLIGIMIPQITINTAKQIRSEDKSSNVLIGAFRIVSDTNCRITEMIQTADIPSSEKRYFA